MGKDSELASTLAQGKTVIAFVPEVKEGDEKFTKWLLSTAEKLYPKESIEKLILQQLHVFASDLAWKDPLVREWARDPQTMDRQQAMKLLSAKIKAHYDKRASTLKDIHPLGIQVNLNTGVANGVLVVRSASECARLIRRVLLNEMEFTIARENANGWEYTKLVEAISGCTYRVVSGDPVLTNAFWNFYLLRTE
ncbi:MAG: hypothetical protein Q8L55_12985 [Phycisphaerales bacterium]|nr:hypothetical protein [Phycisphaerales bacterium]